MIKTVNPETIKCVPEMGVVGWGFMSDSVPDYCRYVYITKSFLVPDEDRAKEEALRVWEYQLNAPDWLRDSDGVAVGVGHITPEGGQVQRIDFGNEFFECQVPE